MSTPIASLGPELSSEHLGHVSGGHFLSNVAAAVGSTVQGGALPRP